MVTNTKFICLLVLLSASSILCQEDPADYDANKEREAQAQDDIQKESPQYPDGVNTIPGEPELDYPIFDKIPKTSFRCNGRPVGFYADVEARCQVWHICDIDSRQQSFLCTNGTVYSQATRTCEWWYNAGCDANEVIKNYEENSNLYVGKNAFAADVLSSERQQQRRPNFIPPSQPQQQNNNNNQIRNSQQSSQQFNEVAQQGRSRGPPRNESPPQNIQLSVRTPPVHVVRAESQQNQQQRRPDPPQQQQKSSNSLPTKHIIIKVSDPSQIPAFLRGQAPGQVLRFDKGDLPPLPPFLKSEPPVPQNNNQNNNNNSPPQRNKPTRPPSLIFKNQPAPDIPAHFLALFARPNNNDSPQQQRQPQQDQRQRPQESQQRPQQQQQQQRPQQEQRQRPQQQQESQQRQQQRPQQQQESQQRQQQQQQRPQESIQQQQQQQQQSQQKPRPKASVVSDQQPQHKFRHSTPRKHNVKFAPRPQSDESQVPEESQYPGFSYPLLASFQGGRQLSIPIVTKRQEASQYDVTTPSTHSVSRKRLKESFPTSDYTLEALSTKDDYEFHKSTTNSQQPSTATTSFPSSTFTTHSFEDHVSSRKPRTRVVVKQKVKSAKNKSTTQVFTNPPTTITTTTTDEADLSDFVAPVHEDILLQQQALENEYFGSRSVVL